MTPSPHDLAMLAETERSFLSAEVEGMLGMLHAQLGKELGEIPASMIDTSHGISVAR